MPRTTYPVERICYADDIRLGIRSKVTGTGSQDQRLLQRDIRVLEVKLSADINPKVNSYSLYPRDEGTFNVHCTQAATRVSNRNNILKALAGTTWGQQKETILMTYKAIERSVANYGAPVWSTNASATNIGKIQIAQNDALRIATRCQASIISTMRPRC